MGKKKKTKKGKELVVYHDYPIRICEHYRLDGSCAAWTTVLCNQWIPGITPNGDFGYYCHLYKVVKPEEVEHKNKKEDEPHE